MKEFRVAEIVPVSCLEETANNQYHMCLAHLVKQSPEYARFYRRMVLEGKYVLMDNGVAENSQLSLDELLECYEAIQPTEVIMPDTICDCMDTLHKAEMCYPALANGPWKVMAVPQGKNLTEWIQCATVLLDKYEVNSIGISKFLEMNTGEPFIRCKAAEWMNSHHPEIEVHLLGCSEGPKVPGICKNVLDNVRGCDSAFAYICTQAGVPININTTRPEGEIDFLCGRSYLMLASNMYHFECAMGVYDNGMSESWR